MDQRGSPVVTFLLWMSTVWKDPSFQVNCSGLSDFNVVLLNGFLPDYSGFLCNIDLHKIAFYVQLLAVIYTYNDNKAPWFKYSWLRLFVEIFSAAKYVVLRSSLLFLVFYCKLHAPEYLLQVSLIGHLANMYSTVWALCILIYRGIWNSLSGFLAYLMYRLENRFYALDIGNIRDPEPAHQPGIENFHLVESEDTGVDEQNVGDDRVIDGKQEVNNDTEISTKPVQLSPKCVSDKSFAERIPKTKEHLGVPVNPHRSRSLGSINNGGLLFDIIPRNCMNIDVKQDSLDCEIKQPVISPEKPFQLSNSWENNYKKPAGEGDIDEQLTELYMEIHKSNKVNYASEEVAKSGHVYPQELFCFPSYSDLEQNLPVNESDTSLYLEKLFLENHDTDQASKSDHEIPTGDKTPVASPIPSYTDFLKDRLIRLPALGEALGVSGTKDVVKIKTNDNIQTTDDCLKWNFFAPLAIGAFATLMPRTSRSFSLFMISVLPYGPFGEILAEQKVVKDLVKSTMESTHVRKIKTTLQENVLQSTFLRSIMPSGLTHRPAVTLQNTTNQENMTCTMTQTLAQEFSTVRLGPKMQIPIHGSTIAMVLGALLTQRQSRLAGALGCGLMFIPVMFGVKNLFDSFFNSRDTTIGEMEVDTDSSTQ